jgi:hypothetical protein
MPRDPRVVEGEGIMINEFLWRAFLWRANKDILRHLDRRILQLDPALRGVDGLLATELECCLIEEAWMEGDTLKILISPGIYAIPMSAILNQEIVAGLVKDRPRIWQ